MLLSTSTVLPNCARKLEELHWIAVWVSFPRSGIVFTSTKSTSLVVTILLGHYLRTYVWLSRMSELSRFVYIASHVTLHVKSNAEKVNCLGQI